MNAQELLIQVYPYLVTVLFSAAFLIALFRYFSSMLLIRSGKERLDRYLIGSVSSDNIRVRRIGSIILYVLFAFFLSRVLILLVGGIGLHLKGEGHSLLSIRKFLFTQWDANHYIGIAENGYQNTGDARLHIVFYPLYPMLVRLLTYITRNTLVSAAIVSNVSFIASGVFLYLLTMDAYGRKLADISVFLYMFSMGAVFYSIPYTESLFVLLTAACVYFARKRRFWLALLMGALSAFTRLPGAVTAVCVFFEMVRSRLGYIRRTPDLRERRKRAAKTMAVSFSKCLLILTGFLMYLLVNKIVTGDAFRFLEYQKNHWGQETGTIFNTAKYSIEYFFRPFVEWYKMGVYFPQCIAIMFAVLLLICVRKDTHPADLAYAVVYLFVVLSPTMLISGPRYISAMYCLYPMTAVAASKNRLLKILIYLFWIAFFLYSSYMFMVEWTYL